RELSWRQSTQACQQEKGRVRIATFGSADDPYRVVLNSGNRLVLNGEILQRQCARVFELRAATSLAHLWRNQSKSIEARNLLAPIYGWFTEGFDTPVLQDAKALLDQLA